jgi:hypothetical protein
MGNGVWRMSERASDCCLMPSDQFFNYIKLHYRWDEDDVHFVLDSTLGWIFLVIAHWNKGPQIDMSYMLWNFHSPSMILVKIVKSHQWCNRWCACLELVDREVEARSGQIKDYKIGICCFSPKHATLMSKTSKD